MPLCLRIWGVMALSDMARRPSGLMRQLDWLWQTVEALKDDAGLPDDPTGDPEPTPSDPGDLNVYFENGLTGGANGNP
jgi:hypothetical protein